MVIIFTGSGKIRTVINVGSIKCKDNLIYLSCYQLLYKEAVPAVLKALMLPGQPPAVSAPGTRSSGGHVAGRRARKYGSQN